MFAWLGNAFSAINSVGQIVNTLTNLVYRIGDVYQEVLFEQAAKKAEASKDTSDLDKSLLE